MLDSSISEQQSNGMNLMSDIERKLASVRRIAEIREIPGADKIVCAVVDGWELVTQKSNGFKPGDLVVYFEIDSLLPVRPEFEFLRDKCFVSAARSVNGEGFRLKTIKLRGQISQGLILPLKELFDWNENDGCFEVTATSSEPTEDGMVISQSLYSLYPEEGDDLTEFLGVKKFEKPMPSNLAGIARGNFPSFIPKTDQERVQNIFNLLQRNAGDHTFEVTIKLDGSSMTVYNKKGPIDNFGVCSRNLDLEETAENTFWKVANKNGLREKLGDLPTSLAIQGELMGPGIQGNREKLEDIDLYVFDMYDIENGSYFPASVRHHLCTTMGLKTVPFLGYFKFSQFGSVKDLLDFADAQKSLNVEIAEGVVFKSLDDPSVSFKVISNKFLLGGGDD